MNMYANLAKKCAVIASAMALCAAAVSGNAADTFAAGKDGVHPHVVGVVAHSDASDVTPRAAADYQGIWQNAPAGSEPGWGIAFAPRGDSVYATWFTYDADGSPMWLALTAQDISGVLDSDYAPQTVFVGSLYRATMSADAAGHPSADLVAYGPAVVEFDAPDLGVFYYNVDGAWRHKVIERTFFADPVAACSSAPGIDGLWTDAAKDAAHAYASGLHVAQRGDVIVATWFTYEAQGKGVWRVMSAARSGPSDYTGTIYQTRGPAITAPFDAAQVAVSAVGAGTLSFADSGEGAFSFIVDGAPAAMPITRRTVAPPAAPCN